nr:MAG TPA: hypothetical protein [Caudoviricetes sp.]
MYQSVVFIGGQTPHYQVVTKLEVLFLNRFSL